MHLALFKVQVPPIELFDLCLDILQKLGIWLIQSHIHSLIDFIDLLRNSSIELSFGQSLFTKEFLCRMQAG